MKKNIFLVLLAAISLTSCSQVQETMYALERNRDAIDASTQTIEENRQAIEQANQRIAENRQRLDEINQALKKAASESK